jgi:hypothetical protein
VNWVAQELQVSVKKAIELVQEYKSNKFDSFATYRVMYRDEVGGLQVTTINERNLQQLQELPYEILSQQIYSISKVDSAISCSMLVDAALSQAEELLKTTVATQESFLTNISGEIHLKDIEVRAVGDRIFSSQNILFKAPSLSAVPISAPPVPPLMKSATVPSLITSKENKTSVLSNTTTAVQSASLKKIAKSNEDAAKKYFGAFVGAPKPLDPVLEDRYVEGAGDDEEEWDDGKVKLADRKQMVKKIASDEIVEFSSPEVDDGHGKISPSDESSEDLAQNRKRKAKVNVLTHGAMDDYMEDIAIEEFKRKQQAEASGEPPLKKKKRVLVEKSFMDNDGYFVTEMVWDEVTDDESELPAAMNKAIEKMAPSISTSKENNPTNHMKREVSEGNKQPLKPKPQPKPVAGTGGQKSMMSFFSKA